MHAQFVISMIIALPIYLLFISGGKTSEDDELALDEGWLSYVMVTFFFDLATGLVGLYCPVIGPSWFQSVFYNFLILFPLLDRWLRKIGYKSQAALFIFFAILGTVFPFYLFAIVGFWELNFHIISWFPILIASMLMGYIWTQKAVSYQGQEYPKIWGFVADTMSVLLFILQILVATSDTCFWVSSSVLREMRPDQVSKDIVEDDEWYEVCNVSHQEFVNYIHSDPDMASLGRYESELGNLIGWSRLGTIIILLWVFSLSFGHGLTVYLFQSRILQTLSTVAYPVYLLHGAVGQLYWILTRGLAKEFWFEAVLGYPIPVEWWETPIILVLTCALGKFSEVFLVSKLMPYTVRLGVFVCTKLECCICYKICCKQMDDEDSSGFPENNFDLLKKMFVDLTGNDRITPSTSLNGLGLDSLGTTALLSTVKASVPEFSSKKLTMKILLKMETVGDLVDFLDTNAALETGDVVNEV
mmetsp:Transcript_16731/g.37628  ORF Transcript_16731/g.37628 Transcript_16731/m.37628 type:complete len:471 (+) Transcript_16731:1802-3214(+)